MTALDEGSLCGDTGNDASDLEAPGTSLLAAVLDPCAAGLAHVGPGRQFAVDLHDDSDAIYGLPARQDQGLADIGLVRHRHEVDEEGVLAGWLHHSTPRLHHLAGLVED